MRTRVGLTGGIASGKSTVARRWAERGAHIIDADQLAREVVAPGEPTLAAIVDRFGPQVLTAAGSLDRAALGRLIFADAAARAEVNAIMHPAIRERAAAREAAAPADAIVVHDIPLLVETGQADNFDEVVVVDVPPQVQMARLRARDGLTEEQAYARINAQASRAERLAAATIVIDNSTDLPTLLQQADAVWRRLNDPAAGEAGSDHRAKKESS